MLASRYVSNSWDYLFGTAEEAVEAFVEDHPELLRSVADGVVELLRLDPSADLMLVLRPLGWGFSPGPEELRGFLRWTLDRVGGSLV